MNIKKLFSMYWNSLKNSKLLKKIVYSYLIVGCAVLFLFAMIIVMMISANSVGQTIDINMSNLEKTVATSDYIFRNISSQYYKYYNDPIIRHALYGKIESPDDYTKLHMKTAEMESAISVIDSVYIINFSDNVVYSTLTSNKNLADFSDKEGVELARKAEEGFSFIPRQKNFKLNNSIEQQGAIICFLMKENNGGAMLVNLSQPIISEMLNLSYPSSKNSMIVTKEGLTVSEKDGESVGADVSEDSVVREIMQREEDYGSFTRKWHPGRIINYARSNINGMTYIVEFSRFSLAFENNNLLMAVITGLIIFMLVSLLITIIFSWNYYKPISTLQKKVAGHYGDDKYMSDADLADVRNALGDAFRSANNYFYIKKKEFVKGVLNGELPAVITEQFNDIKLDFGRDNFYVVQFRLDNYRQLTRKADTDLSIVRYGLINIAEELFSEISLCEGVEMDGSRVMLLCCSDEYDENNIKRIISTIQSQIKSIYDISVTCAVSTVSDEPQKIPSLAKNSNDASEYRFIYGKGAVIFGNFLYNEELRQSDERVMQEIKGIASIISKRDTKKLDERFDGFIKLMRNQEYHNALQYLNLLITKINASTSEEYKASSELSISNVRYESETVDEAVDIIKEYCGMYIASVEAEMEDGAVPERIKGIIQFIDNNYTNSELNIDMIAQEVWLTPNYVRNIFKECTGKTVFEYISQKRFDMACSLLSDTKQSIKTIGTEVGFANANYFYTAFKTRMGMTPGQYRNLKK